jgi:hypothetical protein
VLRVAADLEHALAELGEGHGQVRRGRALADAALAVDGKDLGLVDLDLGIEVDLQAALAVEAAAVPRIDFLVYGYVHGCIHAATSSPLMPSSQSSRSSLARRSASRLSSSGFQ